MPEGKIRAVALAVFVRPRDRAVLAVRLQDQGRVFYRPPGGGIEYGETSQEAACREALEELCQPVRVERLLGIVENIFRHGGKFGHEIMFNWLLHFEDASQYEREEFPIIEANGEAYTAYWVHDDELMTQGTPLFPRDLVKQLEALA